MSQGAKNKSVKKNIEGRTTQISLDVYERVKKDAKYRKMTVDQYLDSILREVIFKPTKTKESRKKDLLGYCPNCEATIKHSTIKLEVSKKPTESLQLEKSFFSRIFKK
ncbi:MAG: hypothetical protein AB8G05_12595 [Oligoflexales bacterium]